jgi:glycosyltransferase involved in cell wall biosynthesis
VSVARLDEQKNLGMMIRAFALFYKNHKDYSLTIYGEGPMRDRIERLISELNLESCVSLPGAKQNVWDLIVNAECFALSSWYEGMPNALLEALCLGLPCVSTRVSGAKDLIVDGVNGFLVDLDDEVGMAQRFELVANERQKACELGKEGANVYELLHIDRISAEWINLFNIVLSSKQ